LNQINTLKAVIKRELLSYLSSFSFMLAIAVYFLLVGLWLWWFPDTSIPDNKFSSLQTLFVLAPWMFLFIIPALTMRSIAEERQSGTLDLLKSKPLTMYQLVMGKFFALVFLIVLILLVSQVYTFSIYQLGYPKGNLDAGGTAGSFLAWMLLASAFSAIGLFTSAVSPNQMIAFLSAAAGCFLLYIGPSFISTLPVFVGQWDFLIQGIGIQSHYESMSRGVITSSDLFYFLGFTGLFLQAAALAATYPRNQRKSILLESPAGWAISSVFIVLSFFDIFSIDLTEDQRHTIRPETKALIYEAEDIIYVKLLFTGSFPAAFTRLKNTALETLAEFNRLNKNIQYEVQDPLEGNPELVRSNQESLRQDGIIPTRLTVFNGKEQEQKIVYPYAVFYFGERKIPVNLLESMDPNTSEDEVLNRSASLLEYKFANAIQKLGMKKSPVVVFTRGHDELPLVHTADLERTLRPVYSTGRITLDSVVFISREIDILIVAKPQTGFSNRDNFLIDQYIMNGGKVIWLIDPLFVNTDTINAATRKKMDFIPLPYALNLEELFFKYGFRILPNVVLDYECSTIPLLTGYANGTPQFEPRPWYFHPLVAPQIDHPVVKNLDRISLYYPATIDTVKTKTPVAKTILLASSMNSRTLLSPSGINFEMVRQLAEPNQFNRQSQPVGLLLEGIFSSAFENRVSESFTNMLDQTGNSYKANSVPNRMLVFSDGDLINNAVSSRGEPAPLGFNMYEQKTYPANKDLMLNSIEYLLDDHQIMSARNKEIRLRLLDAAVVRDQAGYWRWLNTLIPILVILMLNIGFYYWRKWKYA